jgi:hypothetical protein
MPGRPGGAWGFVPLVSVVLLVVVVGGWSGAGGIVGVAGKGALREGAGGRLRDDEPVHFTSERVDEFALHPSDHARLAGVFELLRRSRIGIVLEPELGNRLRVLLHGVDRLTLALPLHDRRPLAGDGVGDKDHHDRHDHDDAG